SRVEIVAEIFQTTEETARRPVTARGSRLAAQGRARLPDPRTSSTQGSAPGPQNLLNPGLGSQTPEPPQPRARLPDPRTSSTQGSAPGPQNLLNPGLGSRTPEPPQPRARLPDPRTSSTQGSAPGPQNLLNPALLQDQIPPSGPPHSSPVPEDWSQHLDLLNPAQLPLTPGSPLAPGFRRMASLLMFLLSLQLLAGGCSRTTPSLDVVPQPLGEQNGPCNTTKEVTMETMKPATDIGHTFLVDGTSPCSGRLELGLRNGSRVTHCLQEFSRSEAEVVCRELGCGSMHALVTGRFFKGQAPMVWQEGVKCRMNETKLSQCSKVPQTCGSDGTVGIMCS
uniref:uncharacterized protein n=1 Tax=Pristiophorus japonicus TaxID=55135 RepID=UPI00398E980D